MIINWPKPRKGTWAWNNQEKHHEAKELLIANKTVMFVVRKTGCPQRTVSGLLAKITQHKNEDHEKKLNDNASIHPALSLWR